MILIVDFNVLGFCKRLGGLQQQQQQQKIKIH